MATVSVVDLTQYAGLAQLQQPDTLSVRFEMEAQEDEAASKEAGRPVFREVEVVEVRIPGDPDIRRRPATEADRQRWPKQYLAFRTMNPEEKDGTVGTLLKVWPVMKLAQIKEAAYFGIQTVEQLASVSDSNLQRLGPGWVSLRNQAKDYLERAKDSGLLTKMRSELDERDGRIKALEQMLDEQKKAIEELRRRK